MNWWVAQAWNLSPALLVSWVYWVIFSIVLHELGHGIAAIRCGDRTPIETGHMTWNPLVHMGSTSLVMFAIVGITWGAMPINPDRFRGRYDEAKVAFAGPAVNLILAVVCLVCYGAWVGAGGGYWFRGVTANHVLYQNVQIFFRVGAMINIVGFLFNLLPVPPLDGSRILGNLSNSYRNLIESDQGRQFALVAMIAVFFFGGRYVFDVAFRVTDHATDHVIRVLAPRAQPIP